MEFNTFEISDNDIESVYSHLPRLKDEIELARLIVQFIELFDEFDADETTIYDKLIGGTSSKESEGEESDEEEEEEEESDEEEDEEEESDEEDEEEESDEEEKDWSNIGELKDKFNEIYEIYSRYYTSEKQKIFHCIATFTPRKMWWDLSEDTYDAMEECINKEPESGVKRHLVFLNQPNNFMTMMVNLVPATESTGEQVIAAEHIYIARGTSNIIYNKLQKGKSTSDSISGRVSYQLHKFAIDTFKPRYVYSAPLQSIDKVFEELVNNRVIKLIWKRIPNAVAQACIPLTIMAKTCENPSVIYKVLTTRGGKRSKKTRKTKRCKTKRTQKKHYKLTQIHKTP